MDARAAIGPTAVEGAAVHPSVAIVGVSSGELCGVRDHGARLGQALEREGSRCELLWFTRRQSSLGAARTEMWGWSDSLPRRLADGGYDAVVLQYSVFAYSHRGLPLFVPATLAALRGSGLPVVGFLHELVFPWSLRGWRGVTWALTQRVALVDAVRTCAGLVVTTDARAEWLARSRWLARRPVALAPVFSNLPPPRVHGPAGDRRVPLVGLFGYAYEQVAAIERVLDAVALLASRGREVQLTLLGGPGAGSAPARRWLALARARAVAHALRVDGPLPGQELSDALAACDVLLFADPHGPSSRKGTLAGSLACGRPVLALDGPDAWGELGSAGAVRTVPARADALASALAALL
ncbi:MAG TPA: glycosyltransferase, partial [Solirubrobacteraceae bacterium]|nr:glycosyltransferase [Solirubrobacteraceae bacterium]